jgi:hypothetical protein
MVTANQTSEAIEEQPMQIVLCLDDQRNIYNNFMESFTSDDAMNLHINTDEFAEHIWPTIQQLLNTNNIHENMTEWSQRHRTAFTNAYNSHTPLNSGRRTFAAMTVEASFVTHILFELYH